METNILIAVPAFGGMIQWRCTETLLQLDRAMNAAGVRHFINCIAHESLIPRARNWFANLSCFATDQDGVPFSHLLFLDADISVNPNDVAAMIQADKPIVVLPYAGKGIDWNAVIEAVKKGASADNLRNFIGSPVIGFFENKGFAVNELTSVQAAGTGAMLVKTSVFEKMAEANPSWEYRPGPPENRFYRSSYVPRYKDKAVDFFKIGIDPETRIYLSEDYFFVKEAYKLGFETFLIPWAKTIHSGSFEYVMDLPAIASLSAKPESA